MFPNQITLKHNKRAKTKEDQMKLYQIQEDIFDPNIDVATTMKKYFKTIHDYYDLKTSKNISFFNFRAENINKVYQKLHGVKKLCVKYGNFYYYDGLELICKKHYKAKNVRLFTNYSYYIKEIDNKQFTIIEPVDNIIMTFDIKYLSYFKLPYCMTVHSVQGLSIDDEITIFDCNTPYVDREFVWTAITRARELKNITFFEHSANEIKRLEESKLKQFLKLKIDGYKRQDLDAKRTICNEMYIDVEWFSDQIFTHQNCTVCNTKYYYVLD